MVVIFLEALADVAVAVSVFLVVKTIAVPAPGALSQVRGGRSVGHLFGGCSRLAGSNGCVSRRDKDCGGIDKRRWRSI